MNEITQMNLLDASVLKEAPMARSETGTSQSELNPDQQAAVSAPRAQAVQVLAGAGTGKTKLIVHRFVQLAQGLLAEGIEQPENRILAVTFTRDAASQLKDKIHEMLVQCNCPSVGDESFISTFHTFCFRLIETHPEALGLTGAFQLIEPLPAQLLLHRLIDEIQEGQWADMSLVLQQAELSDVLPLDMFSLQHLMSAAVPDRLDVFKRIPTVLKRIKASGLSPSGFYYHALRQTEAFTQCLMQIPLKHPYSGESFQEARSYVMAWKTHFEAYADLGWDPLAMELLIGAENLKGSDYLEQVKAIRDALGGFPTYNRSTKNYDPIPVELGNLQDLFAIERQCIQWITGVYALYEHALRASNQIDYDGAVQGAIQLLEQNPAIRQQYQSWFCAKIVDEFQDSNGSELRLLKALTDTESPALTVVGDEKQSIYGFRFSQRENLDLVFQDIPPELLTRLQLGLNYRSRPEILSVANAVTHQLSEKPDLHRLTSGRQSDDWQHSPDTLPVLWLTLGQPQKSVDAKGRETWKNEPIEVIKQREARWIAKEIHRLVTEEGYAFGDVMVLVKKHTKTDLLKEAFQPYGIPMRRKKMLGFFDTPCIQDAMALLALLVDPNLDWPWARLLQVRLSAAQMKAFFGWMKDTQKELSKSSEKSVGFYEVLKLNLSQPLSGWPLPVQEIATPLQDLLASVTVCTQSQKTACLSPLAQFQQAAEKIGLIYPTDISEAVAQKERLLIAFESMLESLQVMLEKSQPSLKEIFQFIQAEQSNPDFPLPEVDETTEGDRDNAVQVMTVHGAKGLEAKVVFVAYCEEKRLPKLDDARLLFDPQFGEHPGFGVMYSTGWGLGELKKAVYKTIWHAPRAEAEEKRLFYVALTRAMERMIVLRAEQSVDWTAPEWFSQAKIEAHRESIEPEWFGLEGSSTLLAKS